MSTLRLVWNTEGTSPLELEVDSEEHGITNEHAAAIICYALSVYTSHLSLQASGNLQMQTDTGWEPWTKTVEVEGEPKTFTQDTLPEYLQWLVDQRELAESNIINKISVLITSLVNPSVEEAEDIQKLLAHL